MPFHRFEDYQSHRFNPHLSTSEGPVIEGQYLYFRLVTKRAGTGSQLHYHPNELMAFPLAGRINCVVGRDRRIVSPGTFVHIPPYAQHQFLATEDHDLHYLYIKDRTWSLIGAAADEALPERAPSAMEAPKALEQGRYRSREKAPERSQAIADGLGNCFYPMTDALHGSRRSGHTEQWVEGTYIGFGYAESPRGHETAEAQAQHERFLYLIEGALDAQVDGESRRMSAGDVMQVPLGSGYGFRVDSDRACYAAVQSLSTLESSVRRHGAADNWHG